MSLTRTVPAAVPSLFHSSVPCVPSLAAKNSVPLTFVRLDGVRAGAAGVDVLDQDGAGGGAVALPQLVAVVPSSAAKNSVPLTFVRSPTDDGSWHSLPG